MRRVAVSILLGAASPIAAAPIPAEVTAKIDASMQAWAKANNVPGLTWGIVHRGDGMVHQGVAGIADVASGRPVERDTRFRIASMTKAFTALTAYDLAAEGRLRLDDKVPAHIPQTAGWAGGLTVTDLVHHMAGFVTDDPWGDRQTPLPEAQFTSLLATGVPFTRSAGLVHEYSNLGYAMLGRIIRNVSGQPFEAEIAKRRFQPLGMTSTTFDLAAVPAAKLASGWRWEDGIWKREPDMAPGTFGAMGGVITTAPDYARWIDHLLSAWPAQIGETGPRVTVRALLRGEGSPRRVMRAGNGPPCAVAVVYGGGLRVGDDCTFGRVAFHGGGYPGYGSHMIIVPDSGWGVFVFTNRTYAGPSAPAWDALLTLNEAGLVKADALPVSPMLRTAADFAEALLGGAAIDGPNAPISPNLLMDRDAGHRAADLAAARAKAGACEASPRLTARGGLEGEMRWTCAGGTLSAYLLLAPTPTAQLQTLEWSVTPRR